MNFQLFDNPRKISLSIKFYLCAAIVVIYDIAYIFVLGNLIFPRAIHP
jgi:hypothetical protein